MSGNTGCPLCDGPGGTVLWEDEDCRVIAPAEPDYPALCRVVWRAHVREMTDLAPIERERCMRVVWALEEALRALLRPDKINLASLGNQVPHLHWHVIPRFADDPHFPDAIWAARRRPGVRHPADMTALSEALTDALRRRLGPGGGTAPRNESND